MYIIQTNQQTNHMRVLIVRISSALVYVMPMNMYEKVLPYLYFYDGPNFVFIFIYQYQYEY